MDKVDASFGSLVKATVNYRTKGSAAYFLGVIFLQRQLRDLRWRIENMQIIDQNLIVVEDEPLIAMMIEELVGELGWTADGSAHSEAEAFSLLNRCEPKLALLDINLGLTTSLAVAAACRDRNIPIVFMTGYSAKDVPQQCGNAPILAKPFSPDELAMALKRAMAKEAV